MHVRRVAPVLLSLLLLATLPAHARAVGSKGFTVEQVLSAPFVSDLIASPKGGAFAWVLYQEGKRNIWIADNGAPRQVTNYTADDGQEILSPAFTPRGDAMVYVRGGDPNAKGENPNPLSVTEGASQSVWIVPVAGGAPAKLGDGNSPAVSPAGNVVVWVQGGALWSAPLDHGKEAKQLLKVRGQSITPAWSPDGSRLAFVSNRGDHNFIAVYDTKTSALAYLAPGVDNDLYPTWSPDGKRIAFARLPGVRIDDPAQLKSGSPWEIWVADAATGEGQQIWRAEKGMGNDYWPLDGRAQLFWGPGDEIAFTWEKDGWMHLYSVAARGGPAKLLTPGAFDIETVTASADGKELVYLSNQGDIDRRHIWRVSFGGAPKQVTSGASSQWSPAPLPGGGLAFVEGGARQPGVVMLLAAGAASATPVSASLVPSSFPAASLVEPQLVTFRADDGLEIHGQLFVPAGIKPGERHPALIFTHGGSRRQMLPGFHYMNYYHNAYAMNQYLANRGFVVLSINYRSGIMYGHDFREAKRYGWQGASEYQDVLAGAEYLRQRADVDANRLGLWGGSYGGYLTAMGLARNSNLFKAGVDFHGVHDWRALFDAIAGAQLGTPDERRVMFESSPDASIETWTSPVLLIHGDDDRNVPFSQSVDLAQRLRERGVECEQLIFPDEIHDILTHAHWLRAYRAAADFLERKLTAK